ncbi:hypothetical protein HHUSO_G21635 [Huso huso]|uniref:Ig-like domain-containing protein n=1 Tax=Huso huso TaxID=61971 RepID=A0ABR0YZD5_HUSHU
MATLFCSLTVLLSITSFSYAVTVTQKPLVLLKHSTEEPVIIHCEHNDNTHLRIYWYRQVRGGGFTLIGYSLEIKTLTSEDTAVYFCASVSH